MALQINRLYRVMRQSSRTTDQQALAAQHDRRAADDLVRQWEPLACKLARRCYVSGADPEDVMQIAMLGLWKAIVKYRPGRGCQFPTFAYTCIRSELDHAIVASRRRKRFDPEHVRLVSLDSPAPDSEDTIADSLADPYPDPLQQIMLNEDEPGRWEALVADLSPRQLHVLKMWLRYRNQRETAARLGCSVHTIGSTMDIVRRKIRAKM